MEFYEALENYENLKNQKARLEMDLERTSQSYLSAVETLKTHSAKISEIFSEISIMTSHGEVRCNPEVTAPNSRKSVKEVTVCRSVQNEGLAAKTARVRKFLETADVITTPGVAEAVGLKNNYASKILGDLVKLGELERQSPGCFQKVKPKREKIADYLQSLLPGMALTPKTLSSATGITRKSASRLLSREVLNGTVVFERKGHYLKAVI